MSNSNDIPVFISFDSDESATKAGFSSCSKKSKINPPQAIQNNQLTIHLPEFNATPVLGAADDISQVDIFIHKGTPVVTAIYNDPNNMEIAEYCCGSGCCCRANRCLC